MKKKIIVVSLIIVLIGLIIGGMYLIDMHRMKNNKTVIFSTWGYDYAPPIQFEILFNQVENSGTRLIIDKNETDKYDYNIYSYEGDIKIKIEGMEYDLKEALLSNKITMEEIIEKANEELESDKIEGALYMDGGSQAYHYNTYTIIKCNTLDGNKDVYIGIPGMELIDV